MFLLDWFYSVLAFLGLWRREVKILFLGTDAASMTSLLNNLRGEGLMQHLISEELSIGQFKFKAFNFVGHHQLALRVWRDYYIQVDAVVYIINPDLTFQIWKSMEELRDFFSHSFANVPLLVLGNDFDFDAGRGPETFLRSCLQQFPGTAGKEVFMCSIVRNMGYEDGFQWLFQHIQ